MFVDGDSAVQFHECILSKELYRGKKYMCVVIYYHLKYTRACTYTYYMQRRL